MGLRLPLSHRDGQFALLVLGMLSWPMLFGRCGWNVGVSPSACSLAGMMFASVMPALGRSRRMGSPDAFLRRYRSACWTVIGCTAVMLLIDGWLMRMA